MAVEDIINFYPMTESIGTGGQPTAEQLADIAAAGYTTVINLAMHDSDNALRDEGSIVASLGMDYVHIPVPFEAPTAAHLRRFTRIMEACDGDTVFVHCALNARVSAFVHQYLTLKKGVPSGEATTPILRQWRPNMDLAWRSIMELGAGDLEHDNKSHPA